MKVDVLLGLQWGDEGKGKIVDFLTPKYDIIARFQGGPNAGHTIEFDNNKFILHTIPSGIFNESKINVIGNGVIIDAYIIMKEIENLESNGIRTNKNLYISRRAHLILPTHRLLDAAYETAKGKSRIGSTLKGIGPTYSDKTGRNGIRVGDITTGKFSDKYNSLREKHLQIIDYYRFDYRNYEIDGLKFEEYEKLWFEGVEKIKMFNLIDSEYYINDALIQGKKILAEGAQGAMLDIDFGTYPFVTSSNTITSGVCSGLGISPGKIGRVTGVFKAYCTRVGSGPFPSELDNKEGQQLRDLGREYGSTTGRPRRCGWLDLTALKYAIMLNGVDELVMMKADVLNSFEKLKICAKYLTEGKETGQLPFDISPENVSPVYVELKGWKRDLSGYFSFDEFPEEFNSYISFIENQTGIPVKIISTGPNRKQTVVRD